jgi:hypothetical protein
MMALSKSAGQFGETGAGGLHRFVEIDEALRSRGKGGAGEGSIRVPLWMVRTPQQLMKRRRPSASATYFYPGTTADVVNVTSSTILFASATARALASASVSPSLLEFIDRTRSLLCR